MGIAGSKALAQRLAELPQPGCNLVFAGSADSGVVGYVTGQRPLGESLTALAAWTGLAVAEAPAALSHAA